MSERLVQITFHYRMTEDELLDTFNQLAGEVAKVPGLHWKIWSLNESLKEASGTYLFENVKSAEAYLKGSLVQSMTSNPHMRDITVKSSNVLTDISYRTRGPIGGEGF